MANSKAKVEEYLKQDLAVKEEVIDALRSFFRGCLVIGESFSRSKTG